MAELNDDLHRFLEMLRVEKNYSPHTLTAYAHDLGDFIHHCELGACSRWRQVDHHLIRRYIRQLHQQGLTGRSLERRLSAIRTLFKFLLQEELADHNPAQLVQAPKEPYRLPTIPDVAQVQALLDALLVGRLGSRDRAVMELFYSSGLRLMELARLNLLDLDMADSSVRVKGKGSYERIVPVGRSAWQAIREWLPKRALMARADEQALFVSQRGCRLSQRAIQGRLKLWSRRLEWEHSLHPHMLRHAFASHILQSSGDLQGVQKLLGHADITTTQLYTHPSFQDLKAVYGRSHPRAKRGGEQ